MTVASKKTLNAKNLEALGAQRLAELLVEISTGNATAKRRLRLELAGSQSPAEVGGEVRKRLVTIGRSYSFIDWHQMKALVEDLGVQRRAIVEQIAKHDASEALELMWRFMALASSIFERCDDSSGTLTGFFHSACEDLGEIATAANADPVNLADRAFQALNENDYGQFDYLISVLTPALGQEGLEHLKQCMTTLSKQAVQIQSGEDRQVVGWGSGGPIYADEMAERSRVMTARLALKEIADAQGDVDAFIDQYDDQSRRFPKIAAQIAQRLLATGRTEEAWQTIEATEHRRSGWPDFEWEDARIDVFEALGCDEKAQAARWSCFERSLSAVHLRAYLKQLPDFADVEAEERALEHAQGYGNLLQALSFLVSWRALVRAADLVVNRAGELDGDHYEILTPAARVLVDKHPLAATLVLRAMINFSLTKGRSSRYRHAARHLMECESLDSAIQDFGAFETHEAYTDRLRDEHGRKRSFWTLIT